MHKKGFTLIEIVIAIFVLSIAVVGIYSALSLMVVLTANYTDRLVASYLAQEGAEIVRNIRDQNWISNSDTTHWMDGLSDCDSGCYGDYTSTSLTQASDSDQLSSKKVLYMDARGFYRYSASLPTKFIRVILVSPSPNNPDKVKVSVTVYFPLKNGLLNFSNNSSRYDSVTVEEYLYNWY